MWSRKLCNGGNVSVLEVNGLVKSAAQSAGVSGKNILFRNFALFDLGDASFSDTHAIGDLLLCQTVAASDFS